ncbi:MAG TPA: hypothetical protein VFE72_02860 [Lysobacter sp.]|nr:hypothetical protein [Lysobacter sp.]
MAGAFVGAAAGLIIAYLTNVPKALPITLAAIGGAIGYTLAAVRFAPRARTYPRAREPLPLAPIEAPELDGVVVPREAPTYLGDWHQTVPEAPQLPRLPRVEPYPMLGKAVQAARDAGARQMTFEPSRPLRGAALLDTPEARQAIADEVARDRAELDAVAGRADRLAAHVAERDALLAEDVPLPVPEDDDLEERAAAEHAGYGLVVDGEFMTGPMLDELNDRLGDVYQAWVSERERPEAELREWQAIGRLLLDVLTLEDREPETILHQPLTWAERGTELEDGSIATVVDVDGPAELPATVPVDWLAVDGPYWRTLVELTRGVRMAEEHVRLALAGYAAAKGVDARTITSWPPADYTDVVRDR